MIKRLRIASWNIRKAVGLDWRRDPARVLRVLEWMRADIVILQEADKRLPPRPPALPPEMVHAAGWTMIDADPATPSIGHHGNAVLMRSEFRLLHLDPLDLPGLEPRGAVLARLEGHGTRLTIGALHLGLRRPDRLRQMQHVLEAAGRFGGPVVLGGDLNEWRPRETLLPPSSDWTGVVPGPSFHSAAPKLNLDRFVISPDVAMRECGVVHTSDSERASDHLPIWIEVSVPAFD